MIALRGRRLFGAALAGIALVVVACSPNAPSPVIDTWPVGEEYACDAGDARCQALIPTAIAGLDARNPGHAPVLSVSLHREGALLGPSGEQILMTRSGDCCSVAVLQLANGEIRAIGVGYPGVSDVPVAIPEGP